MGLKITEFFGRQPLDATATLDIQHRRCPFVSNACIKPNHGACSVRQTTSHDDVICCPNRLYAENFQILRDVCNISFGPGTILITPDEMRNRHFQRQPFNGNEVVVFGRYSGQELPLPKAAGGTAGRYYVDWILARVNNLGQLNDFTAAEVQTIDTTGNYSDQAQSFFQGQTYFDAQGRQMGFSNAGMNWENVSKRILPQIIYKGHVLRREQRCSKGLFFVCPSQVAQKIYDRLGRGMHGYNPGNGTITFLSYELGPPVPAGQFRSLVQSHSFTTTVDQVALAFTAPMHLPDMNVYENAIRAVLG